MKSRLLPTIVSAMLVTASWATIASACEDKAKSTQSATNVSAAQMSTCSAAMAAKCTPSQAAACKAKMGASATTASSSAGYGSAYATASACKAHGTAAMTASAQGSDHCAGAAAAKACKASKSNASAAAGHSCSGHGMVNTADKGSHADCDACADMAACEQALEAAGGQTQIVPLKNGVMFVYTTEGQNRVHAVQAAMARRTEHLVAMTSAGDRATLCPECKAFRGAVASGKLSRETVNIEGGCLTLMTSNDPSIVNKLHAMAGAQTTARIKS